MSGGGGYTTDPEIIFTRDTDLVRSARNRQSLNSVLYNLTGLLEDADSNQTTLHVETTNPYPGSGKVLIGREVIRYTGKTATSLTGCDRGINFRFDQKVILDNLQDDPDTGLTQYNFQVTDKVRRVIESSTNRVAIVYDWDPTNRALYLTFQVDELAFIDGGRSNEKAKIIAFVAGTAGASGTGVAPHNLVESVGNDIVTFTVPFGAILNRAFEDIAELDGLGDGIADLINTGTEFENQISLDGGIASSLYGIEETLGGQNTTLFQAGDQIYDGSLNSLVATIQGAGALGDGDAHVSGAVIKATYTQSSAAFTAVEASEGLTSGVTATNTAVAVGDTSTEVVVTVKSMTSSGANYKFQKGETLRGNSTGATAVIDSIEYTTYLRDEED